MPDEAESSIDALIVGAGPTGLTLAAQLSLFGVRFRIIDRAPTAAHESRALAVQARTLELLQTFGLGEALVGRGNPSAHLALHFDGKPAAHVQLGGFAAKDTRFPFILFVSQAETEALLGTHLERGGTTIERGIALVSAEIHDDSARCVLRGPAGSEETLRARFLVGCDGAHSAVRKQAGMPFEGEAYLQDFMLGDVDADGPIEPDVLHSFAAEGHVAMFFPLRTPAKWRVIALGQGRSKSKERVPPSPAEESLTRGELSLDELQRSVDRSTSGAVRLRDPVWLTHFRLHHRQARTYRKGPVFLAGDAAHIHSPVGAQGMNTGMQDAWNLGWKLALVALGRAEPKLLDTYEAERWPVGRNLLRYTDRAFSVFTRAMAGTALAAWFRRTVVSRVLPLVFRWAPLRKTAFRFVSELAISYRGSPGVAEARPKLRSGPRAGDRLPDARIERDGRSTFLQQELAGATFQLLLCGQAETWDTASIKRLAERFEGFLAVRRLAREGNGPDLLIDVRGEVFDRLGVRAPANGAQYLVRPDGYIAFRCAGRDLGRVANYLASLSPPAKWPASPAAGSSSSARSREP